MARQTKLPIVEAALREKKGNVYLASKMLGITRQALNKRIQRHKCLQEIKAEYDEVLLDVAEAGLFNSLTKEQPWAIKFTLSTKGVSRGYVQKTQTEDVTKNKQVFKIGNVEIPM